MLFLPITIHYTKLSHPLAVVIFVTVFVSLALIRFECCRRKRHKPADPLIRPPTANMEHPKGKYCFSGTIFNVEEKFLIMFCTDKPINMPQSFSPPFPPVWSFLSSPSPLPLHAWRSREMRASTCLTDYCNSYTLISCTNH